MSSRPALAVWLYGTRVAELSEGIDWRWTRDAYDRWGANSRVVSQLPGYDLAMHLHHQRADPLSALDVNGKFHLTAMGIHDVQAEGNSWGLFPEESGALIRDVAARLDTAIAAVDLRNYPGVPAAALETVARRTKQALDRL